MAVLSFVCAKNGLSTRTNRGKSCISSATVVYTLYSVEEEFKKVLTTDLLEAVENVQSFTGCVKLNRIFREEVVVGYHKTNCGNGRRFTTSVSVYSVSSGNGTNRLLIELFITTDSFSYFAIRPCVGKYLSSSSVFPVLIWMVVSGWISQTTDSRMFEK
jgi:hypothetical protein